MGDIIFNEALGRIREYADDAAGDIAAAQFVLILLTAAEATDAAQRDFNDIAALLAGASAEATFTNYARKDIENASITVTVDDTNERVDIDIPDQTFTAAGNGANNTMTDAVVAFDLSGTDADAVLEPISQHDFTPTTDGSDLTLQVATAGLLRAS